MIIVQRIGIFVLLAILALGCGKKSSTSDAASTATTTVTNALTEAPAVVAGALALLPSIGNGTALVGNTWTEQDKTTYIGDIAFEIAMRFMDTVDASVLSAGNASLRNNLELGQMYMDVPLKNAAGSVDATVNGMTIPVVVGASKTATAAAVSPFNFGKTAYSSYDKVVKSTIALTGGTVYSASKLDGDTAYLLGITKPTATSLLGGSGGGQSEYITMVGIFNNTKKDIALQYAGNKVAGTEHYIIRMDFGGNSTTKDFTLKTAMRNTGSSSGDGFSMLATGSKATSGKMLIKAKQCMAADDSASCIASATSKWFCVDSDATLSDWEIFVKSGDKAGSGYTNTTKIVMTLDPTTLTDKCAEYYTAMKDTTYVDGIEADMPASEQTYYSTLGYE